MSTDPSRNQNPRGRLVLRVTERILLASGVGVVSRITRDGYSITEANGTVRDVAWIDLIPIAPVTEDGVRTIHRQLSPWWEMLPKDARQEALTRLEVVLEILTGFRDGLAELARDGEPFDPYGPIFGGSLKSRCIRMAAELSRERGQDRSQQRRILRGELKQSGISTSTVRNWVLAYQDQGLLGLVDGRKMRKSLGFEVLDPVFRDAILDIVETFDGDRSAVNHKEIIRLARMRMKEAGREAYAQPARATGEYVAWLFRERGHNTRAQRSNAIRGTSGKTHFPAIRVGQVVAIDATRADVLVWDPLHERPISVEVLTAIDVASRCVVACRIVPKSADAVDASLLLYDVMRPHHMVVAGTNISDWRWAGLPESLDLSGVEVVTEHGPIVPRPLAPAGTLQGRHTIPAVMPEAIRCDHGSIFTSKHFYAVCDDFGIEVLLSRGRRPSDNAHVERYHRTLDGFWQQLSGYKSHNVAGRGRKVEDEPLYTAAELEVLLRRWIALDYHQRWHEGLVLPDAPGLRLTPIEYFDISLERTGRIDVPVYGPYAFLPIRWGTVGHAGVEFDNLVYDSSKLDDFRNVRVGQFREKDRAIPFFHDPHDVSRVWWMDPDTELVHEIPWRGSDQFDAPMNDAVLAAAWRVVARRGGNLSLNKDSTERLILNELRNLFEAPPTRESRAMLSAAARRVESSERDHAEARAYQAARTARAAMAAQNSLETSAQLNSNIASRESGDGGLDLDEPWPDFREVM